MLRTYRRLRVGEHLNFAHERPHKHVKSVNGNLIHHFRRTMLFDSLPGFVRIDASYPAELDGGAIHSTKNSGLSFRNFRASKGTVFSTGRNRSRQNGGLAMRLVCHSSTISSKQTISILQNDNEIIITY